MSNAYAFHITVKPQYLPEQSSPAQGLYTFAYKVAIENQGQVAAQLIARHWEIEDAHGQVETVDGLGVVGQQPLLQPGEAFEYTSGAQLRTPAGMMSGYYFFVAVDGTRFDAAIAPFVLQTHSEVPGNLH
ncbi:MAG: Co2+/Mg2+ efflux protein ApaG [Burkholderiaceae bacterium]|nr:Co2+/Mg2+ efflux protein ApaG [Burkholderiaceae bacterium]